MASLLKFGSALMPDPYDREDFRADMEFLDLNSHHLADLFGVDVRTVNRWRSGQSAVPVIVRRVMRSLRSGPLTFGDLVGR